MSHQATRTRPKSARLRVSFPPVGGEARDTWRGGLCGPWSLVSLVTVSVMLLAFLVDTELRRMHHVDLSEYCSAINNNSSSNVTCVDRELVVAVSGNVLAGGHLAHVLAVFERLGYRVDTTSFAARAGGVSGSDSGDGSGTVGSDEFDVLWSHEYPFRVYDRWLRKLRPGQMVNHFPGSGFITSKVELAVAATGSADRGGVGAAGGRILHVPRAFKLPRDAEMLRQYARADPTRLFVQKSNAHRNIRVRSFDELDLNNNSTFVQEFVGNPLLIDGYKFDIGVYAVLTSVDPLRVYVYEGDVLLRFCRERYHPFSAEHLARYVIGDDYLPTWRVPALADYYSRLKLGHRGSLNAHLTDRGLRPRRLWRQIDAAVRSVYTSQAPALRRSIAARHGAKTGAAAASVHGHYFEMVRFDFLVDDELNVYLLEANMSPNLSSRKHPHNRLLYEQVLYSVLSVVGVANRVRANLHHVRTGPASEMWLALQQLSTYGRFCGSSVCRDSLSDNSSPLCSGVCRACVPCLSADDRRILLRAAQEHYNRHQCRRLLPDLSVFDNLRIANTSTANNSDDDNDDDLGGELSEATRRMLEHLTPNNRLQLLWFRGKCLVDRSWC